MKHDILITPIKRTRVKFCGITQLDDAHYAEYLGVDAMGFVFYEKSPRVLSITAAEAICQTLSPFITKVGLFVNPSKSEVEAVLQKVNLDLLQFHGDEAEDFCRQFNKPYIKAVAVRDKESMNQATKLYPSAAGLLLDTFHQEKKGGTGEVFDWSLISSTHAKPIILAGGLTIENVRLAIETVKPYAVDVSSGIELNKTKKDFDKMRRFIEEVRHAKQI